MKKSIVILGSTGSIGKQTISIIRKYKKNFRVKLLSTNTSVNEVIDQAKEFDVKNIIITNHHSYLSALRKYKKLKINFYNNFNSIHNIFKKKIFYTMISIVGLEGLNPSLTMIKYSRNIAIANKESILCAWDLIKNELRKNKTNFIPVDSEHFSIYSLINSSRKNSSIEKVFITASGGPFLKTNYSRFKYTTPEDATKHPNWNMGKKISIDSSTMMNKVFEVIEAKKIFNLKYNDIEILIHPKSYVHAILKFNNGLIKMLLHEPSMKIPIFNSIFHDKNLILNSKKLDLKKINNLEFSKVDYLKFPLVKILKNLKENESLYETTLIVINDFFVSMFLEKKINYLTMLKLIFKCCNYPFFLKYRKKSANNINDILKCREKVYMKLNSMRI